MSDRLALRGCQRRLVAVWGALGGVTALVVLVQTLPGGVYERDAGAVWDWFLPSVVPTLSLMLGTVVANAQSADESATVDPLTYRVALWGSVAYLLLVLALLFVYAQSADPAAGLKGSGRLVTALYTLVGIALGTFFVSVRKSG